jgi:hypothetical protein
LDWFICQNSFLTLTATKSAIGDGSCFATDSPLNHDFLLRNGKHALGNSCMLSMSEKIATLEHLLGKMHFLQSIRFWQAGWNTRNGYLRRRIVKFIQYTSHINK